MQAAPADKLKENMQTATVPAPPETKVFGNTTVPSTAAQVHMIN